MRNHKEYKQIVNGTIMVIACILKMVVASASEAEVGALFHTAQEIVPLRMAAIKLGHLQPPTPNHTNNSTAMGIINFRQSYHTFVGVL